MVVEIENSPWKNAFMVVLNHLLNHDPYSIMITTTIKRTLIFGIDLSLETKFQSCHRGAPIHHPRNMDDHDLETMVMIGYPMTQETPIQGNMLIFPSHSCGENRLVPLFFPAW